MHPSFLEHASTDRDGEQLEALRQAHVALSLRTLEVMFLDLRSVFEADPGIGQVWFDLDSGDPDSFPVISIDALDGHDVDGEPEIAEAIAQRWNDTALPMLVSFLETNDGRVFHRHTFPEDVGKACQNMKASNAIPLEGSDYNQWVKSFVSHLRGMALDQTLDAGHAARPPRM